MSIVLFFDQAWWTVAGLGLDIVGVTIVAKNWRAVYRKAEGKQSLKLLNDLEVTLDAWKHSAVEEKPPFTLSPEDERLLAGASKAFKENRELVRGILRGFVRFTFHDTGIESAWNELAAVIDGEDVSDTERRAAFEKARSALRGQYDLAVSEAKWDFSTIALIMIVTGFVFQLIGAIPL
ncbi:hypothetical protein FIU93_28085 [Labrenzia sp. THAF35]|uniref:hypothetical protein n=1 Tax=Labrenzia sp. THAF35 TaxID=2587854 RepID=UPI001269242E|nr:hypothetical protein [Labrenzia sp. THAF35]QFT70676.1 hypothetical protein FIU93_28085 [Labrenzia sp. THAF35]